MKATGIVRKFDENGRFVIPMEIRKILGLTTRKDALEVFMDGKNIILKKYDEQGTGVVRKFDENGRFVIPMEIRKQFGLTTREDALEVFVDEENNNIILRKYEPGCTFCQSMKDIIDFKEKKVCKKCIQKLVILSED